MSPDATGISNEDIHFYQFDPVQPGDEVVLVETTAGDITLVLFPEAAPNTVAYFKELVSEGFYDGRDIFPQSGNHLFITGATDAECAQGKTPEDGPIESEITPDLWHFSGAVSVLGEEKNRFSRETLSDSRFFIVGDVEATTDMVSQMEDYVYPQKVIDAYKEHGGLPQYTGIYTVFGQVVEGMDVVNTIASMAANDHYTAQDGTKIERITLTVYQPSEEGVI